MKGSGNGLLGKSLLGLAMLVLVMMFSVSCVGSESPQGGGGAGGSGTPQQAQGNGGELDGTWVWSGSISQNPDVPGGRATLEFNSNQFTMTVDDFDHPEHRGFTNSGALFFEMIPPALRESRAFVGSIDGGRHYTVTVTGTFALTNDRMELIYSDGTVRVLDFSRTPNTFDISVDLTNVGATAVWSARFILQS